MYQLVTSVIRDIDIESADRDDGTVELSDSAADPVSVVEPKGAFTGFLVEGSWVLDQAKDSVIHRFRERDRPPVVTPAVAGRLTVGNARVWPERSTGLRRSQ